ncbi:MAG TPA: hypothetical protein VGV89_04065 [Thermoplasmata archaeon]|nr:hypothetical protein [Thermoplasmata archaeon]
MGTGVGIAAAAMAEARSSLTYSAASPLWHQAATTGKLPKVGGQLLVYDASDHYVFMFGGRAKWTTFNHPFDGGDWAFANGTWRPLVTYNGPYNQGQGASAYDAADGYVVLFGGEQQGGGPHGAGLLYYTYTYHAGNWTKLTLTVHPGTDVAAAMAYDPSIQRVILYGGSSSGVANQTWMFHAGKWTQLHPATTPPSLSGAAMTYYAPGNELLLYGGVHCVTYLNCSESNATWAFAGGTWSRLSTPVNPGPRDSFTFAYDPPLRAAVLFGGSNLSTGQNDTWLFQNGRWALYCAPCGPNPREIAKSTYDPALPGLLLYGGYSARGFSNQTWELS